MEDCKPSTSAENIETNLQSTKASKEEKYSGVSEDSDVFYFESEHLALKGNKDYHNVLKTIAILEAQRVKAIRDYDRILEIQEEALLDPLKFVERLQSGEDVGIPREIDIAEIPNIDWSAYNVSTPFETAKPQTRKTLITKHTSSSLEHTVTSESDICDFKSRILVRGRPFDDSKPETFNQLWTAEEQRRLEELLVEYPPEEVETRRWQKIAAALGNRTTKQVCSRVQKYFIKLHKAGLPIPGRAPKMQSSEVIRKGYHTHRHQRNNHFLFKQTTFFPSQDVPVYMSDFDDEIIGNYSANMVAEYEDDKSDVLSDDGTEKVQSSVEIRQLCLLQRVRKDKENCKDTVPMEHVGYKCDLCEQEPLVGTRWHCIDCPPNVSVDYCTDCVVTQMDSSTPHPLSHRLVEIRRKDDHNQSVWDADYTHPNFSVKPNIYNYLDPNFMPE